MSRTTRLIKSVLLSHILKTPFITDLNQVIADLKSLKDNCVLPDTQKPYIKSIAVGADNSDAGLNVGAADYCYSGLPGFG